MLVDLMGLPRGGVFVVIDREGRRAYINYSTNLPGVLLGLYDQLGEIRARGTTLDFEVLSVSTDIETLKLHTEYWRDKYVRWGFGELLPVGRKSIRYEVRCLVGGDYDVAEVVLVTARGDKRIVVGRFKRMEEAQDFIETYYADDNPYRLPVYATNSLTKEYLLALGIKKDIITL